ncbi:F0F1 ATP synthase subunit B [Candidatus Kaiserbacteria bacterium]|nr:F0F1 ATP synthase subunit B [Candidatus Kaiserbacteria bacterium]
MDGLLSTFGISWKLLLAQGFNFAVVLVVLWKFLYQPVLKMIDERRKTIAKGVEDAQAAAEKLALADGEGQGIITKASQAAESMYATARTRAEEKGSAIIAEAQKRADAGVQEARMRAFAEAKEIRAASEKEIVHAAIMAAEKILRNKQT